MSIFVFFNGIYHFLFLMLAYVHCCFFMAYVISLIKIPKQILFNILSSKGFIQYYFQYKENKFHEIELSISLLPKNNIELSIYIS